MRSLVNKPYEFYMLLKLVVQNGVPIRINERQFPNLVTTFGNSHLPQVCSHPVEWLQSHSRSYGRLLP